jgi:hypothetical protein
MRNSQLEGTVPTVTVSIQSDMVQEDLYGRLFEQTKNGRLYLSIHGTSDIDKRNAKESHYKAKKMLLVKDFVRSGSTMTSLEFKSQNNRLVELISSLFLG